MCMFNLRSASVFLLPFTRFLLPFSLFLTLSMTLADTAQAEALSRNNHWPACSGASRQLISFVHISDMHARYNPEAGGETPVGRIRGYYEAVRKENPYTVFTNAGDDYEKGSVVEEFSRGESTREVVKALAYHVRTLGNHDFAWGPDELLQYSADPHAVVLSANSRLDGGGEHGSAAKEPWKDYAELQVGCLRIGVFGLTTRPYDSTGRQHDGPVYPDFPALVSDYDHLSIARRIIREHRQEVDLLVLVSHLGITDDIRVAEATEGIDLILGGHSHTVLNRPVQVKGTRIVHAGANAEYIGRYDLEYDLNSGRIAADSYRLVENRPGIAPACGRIGRAVAAIVHRYRPEPGETVTTVKNEHDRRKIAEIAALAANSRPGVDAALVDPASVWQDTWRGPLSRQDLFDTFKVEREPVGTTGTSSLYLLRVKGADLLRARQVLRHFAYSGPSEAIREDDFYTIALQKAQAIRQENYFGRSISTLPPQPAAELWQTVADLARIRGLAGLTLDGELEARPIGENRSVVVGVSRNHGDEGPQPRS